MPRPRTILRMMGNCKPEPAFSSSLFVSSYRIGSAPISCLGISRDDDHGSVDSIVLDGGEGFVGLVESENGDLGLESNVGGDLEKIAPVGARHSGPAADLALAPQQPVVVELWDAVEMNGVDGNDAPFA